jgi:hypothetical protein
VQDTFVLTSGTQASANRRGLFSAALTGSGFGLALGAIYLAGGMAQAVSDHSRAARIAEAAQGGFSETMLQREIARMDPGALQLARAHDAFAADNDRDSASGWPSRSEDRQPLGHRGSALDSARQLDCLTQAVYFEARGETARGQAAVAQVVMNRVNSPAFPKTVCGVVFQGAATHGCQFSFACDGSMRHSRETVAWDRARRIAERTLAGVMVADIGNATHFHTLSVQPAWGPQFLRVAQVGLHVFYRFNPHAPLNRPADQLQADNRAVFVSLPGPVNNIRVATALLQKTADATVAATLGEAPMAASATAEGKPASAKAADTVVSQGKAPDAVNTQHAIDTAAS